MARCAREHWTIEFAIGPCPLCLANEKIGELQGQIYDLEDEVLTLTNQLKDESA